MVGRYGNRLQLLYPTRRLLEYEYDAIDRIQRIVEPFPESFTTSNRTTPSDPTTKTVAPLTIIDYSWIGPGACHNQCPCESRVLLQTYGNATRMSFLDAEDNANIGYNDVKEVVALTHWAGDAAFVDRTYDYNRAYKRTEESHNDIIGAPTNRYEWDSVYRSSATVLGADASPEGFTTQIDYTLDGVGNRRTWS